MLSQKKIKIFKNAILSILCFASAYFIAFFKPTDKFIANQSELRERSLIFFFWETPPMPVLLKVYIFNVTNSDAFQKGIDKKLKVKEIGPYVYREYLHHSNVKFHENGTVTYVPVRRTIPVPELSIGDPNKDIITTVNIPLIGLSDVAADISAFAALGMSTLARSTHARPFINLTVHDYLWGYEDNLVKLANNVLPNIFHFSKLGIMDRLFDEGDNTVTMNLPSAVKRMKSKAKDDRLSRIQEKLTSAMREHKVASPSTVNDVEYDDDYFTFENFNGLETMAQTLEKAEKPDDIEELDRRKDSLREYSIDSWNGSPGMKQWGYDSRETELNSKCNTLRGAYDGTLFPKNIMIGEEFKLYRRAFCRTLRIRAEKPVKTYGINTIQFALVDDAFDDSMNDTDSACFCKKRGFCMKKGLGYAGSCYFTVPIAVSLPHFYKSDPRLYDEIEGMKPDREKHETIVMIQPNLGVPIRVQTRLQLNMVIGDTKFNSDLKNMDNQIYPLFWTELEMTTLTPGVTVVLMVVFFLLPTLEILLIAIFIMKGFYHGIKAFLISLPCPKSAPMKFPSAKKTAKLCTQKSIKYSAVFPYIGREVMIFEDKERNLISNAENV